MNIFEQVMLTSDSSYIPVKYAVMDCNIGSTLSGSYVWLKCVSYGVDTEENLLKYYDEMRKSYLKGTLGEYVVTSIDKIKPYQRTVPVKETNVSIG